MLEGLLWNRVLHEVLDRAHTEEAVLSNRLHATSLIKQVSRFAAHQRSYYFINYSGDVRRRKRVASVVVGSRLKKETKVQNRLQAWKRAVSKAEAIADTWRRVLCAAWFTVNWICRKQSREDECNCRCAVLWNCSFLKLSARVIYNCSFTLHESNCLKLVSSEFAPSRFSLPRWSKIEYEDILKGNNNEMSCLAMICV